MGRFLRRLFGVRSPLEEELKYLKKNGLKMGKNVTINSGCCIDSGWPWLILV